MTRPQWTLPPPGRMIDVDGLGMHLLDTGEGTPAVIMEAAIGDFSLTWSLVHNRVSKFTRAIAHDRAGLGWSDASTRPRAGEVMAQELRSLLARADVPPPFLLVGHSFSGLLVRIFAAMYPSDVMGMVLLDPAHEDQFLRFPPPIREAFGPLRSAQVEQLRLNAEQIRAAGPGAGIPLVVPSGRFEEDITTAYRLQSIADPSRVLTVIGELQGLEETQSQVRARKGQEPAQYPLTVVSHGQPQAVPGMSQEINIAYEEAWQAMQVEIAGLSRLGRRIVAHEAGHMIHHDAPDLVAQEICTIVEQYAAALNPG